MTNLNYNTIIFKSKNDLQLIEIIENYNPHIYNEIESQLRELVKILNPTLKFNDEIYRNKINEYLGNTNIDNYGVWVYYEWCNKLVHLLPEKEFILVRTNRNQYKITPEERDILTSKKIGIVGLSVGQSIAITLAIERCFGEIRLADFDTLELSNLNRIRSGVFNLGIPKVIIAAREIAEIDPFLKVILYPDGLTNENMNDFFTKGGKLDIFIEECDGLEMKIKARIKAKELGIPVLMDTNDRGMIDIERFDLEPERPILHGLVGNIELNKLNGLTNEEKIPYILPMVGIDSISPRLKASMMEIEQTITSWPQLSSSVALGGAIITDVSRRILLNQMSTSGRFYIDLDELIPNDLIKNSEFYNPDNEPKEKGLDYFSDLIFESNNLVNAPIIVDEKTIKEIVNAACLAPSGGNMQPWKWIWNKNTLFLFHEKASSFSFLDYNNLGSYIAFGAAIENIKIVSATYNLKPQIEYFPLSKNKELIAIIQFEEIKMNVDELTKGIYSRNTNRKLNERVVIEKGVLNEIALALNAFENTFVKWINDENEIEIVADIVTTTDKIRILQPQGHYDLFNKEIRWNAKQVNETKDGIDIDTLEISNGEKAAMKLATDQNAIDYLRKWNLGDGFKKISMKSVQKSGAIGLIYFNKKDELSYFNAGSALQRVWIKANNLGLSFHPISACTFMFQRILEENESSFNDKNTEKLKELHKKFNNLWKFNETETGVFMFKLHLSNDTSIRSLRKPLDEMFRYK